MAGEDAGIEVGASKGQDFIKENISPKSKEVSEAVPNNDSDKQVSTVVGTKNPESFVSSEVKNEPQNSVKENNYGIKTEIIEENEVQDKQEDGITPLTFQEKIYNFLNRGEAKKLRGEVEEIAGDLSNRLDIQKLMQDDLIIHTSGQYREVLGILNGINEGKHNSQGYIENTGVKSTLERIRKEWEEKGFLKDQDKTGGEPGDKTPVKLSEDELLKRRNLLLENVISNYGKMEESHLSVNAKDSSTNFVSELTNIKTLLNLEDRKEKFNLSRYGYKLPEFDQIYLDAMKQHTQNLFDSHREAVVERIREHQKDMSEQNLRKLADAFAPQVRIGWEESTKENN